MSEILTEPSSPREDHKVWVWRYGDAISTPVKVTFTRKSTNSEYFEVPTTMYARVVIKDDLRDSDAILDKVFQFTSNGIFIIEFTTEEVIQLRAGKTYQLGVALYDEDDTFLRTLVQDLPLRIEKSALNKSVF